MPVEVSIGGERPGTGGERDRPGLTGYPTCLDSTGHRPTPTRLPTLLGSEQGTEEWTGGEGCHSYTFETRGGQRLEPSFTSEDWYKRVVTVHVKERRFGESFEPF